MDGAKAFVWVVLILVGAYLFVNYQGTPASTPAQQQQIPISQGGIGCGYAPTVQLGANNKYDAGQTNWGNWKFKLNGGTTTTDSDGSFEVSKTDKLEVLVADSNSSLFYRAIAFPCEDGTGSLILCSDKSRKTAMRCEKNSMAYNNVIQWDTIETKCFNDENNPMNGTTYTNNLTIGTAGTRSVECQIESEADKGMPYGGVMVLEMNGTTYEENKIAITWEGATLGPAAIPSKYTVGATTGITRTFSVPAFEDAKTIRFHINNIKAESGVDPSAEQAPTPTSYGDNIVGHIYPINCYEEEDVTPSEFRCGLEDLDSTFTSPGGTEKTTAAITTFMITVS